MDGLERLDDIAPAALPEICAEIATHRVRFDRPDLGVWFLAVAEVCASHAESAARLGGLGLGEIPRHATASP
ncbi:hypothetical protein GCM10010109_69350 [Actinoplanes campanulatus]|nr:hypothetical protein GCM10010109_69350 [Actinoplanes campanulatus]GID40668.1 hypothetical protein Aca09nite_71740 [Actinoplanes campanulatus]